LVYQREIRKGDEKSHADIGHMTKMAIFADSRWRTTAILKIALSPYRAVNYPISISSIGFWPINAKFGIEMMNDMQI